jgi:uncharacterized protein (DUF362 family)
MKVLVQKITNLEENIKKVFFEFPKLSNLKNKKVIVKPNWVAPRTTDTGVTTNLELIENLIIQLKKQGTKILIAESAGYEFNPEETNKILKTEYLTQKYKVPILNTRDCQTKTVNIKGKVLRKIKIPTEVLKADLIFNLPKLKTHMLTDVSFSLKNFLGLLPLEPRRRAHTYGIHQAIVDLGKFFIDKTFVIIDGTTGMSDCGPAFGNVIRPNLLIASENCLAADLACCKITNIKFEEIKHLRLAREQMESNQLAIVGDQDYTIKNFVLPKVPKFYRNLYRGLFILEEFLPPIFKKPLVAKLVSRFGTRPIILKKQVKNRKELIKICPIGAIKENLEIDFEKCRYVRCLKCYDKFPRAIKLRGISRPKRT